VIDGEIVGRGHNRRVQQGSVVLHAEMDCLERAGRLRAGPRPVGVSLAALHGRGGARSNVGLRETPRRPHASVTAAA